jgi:hypothetical protein
MGVSAEAYLIAGVPASRKKVKKTVKRFHEITGEPYDKVVEETVFEIAGRPFGDDVWEKLCESGKDELRLISSEGDRNMFVGIVFASTEDICEGGNAVFFAPIMMQTAMDKAAAKLQALGFMPSDVNYYLVPEVNC